MLVFILLVLFIYRTLPNTLNTHDIGDALIIGYLLSKTSGTATSNHEPKIKNYFLNLLSGILVALRKGEPIKQSSEYDNRLISNDLSTVRIGT